MPRSRDTTGPYTGSGSSDDRTYGSQNFDRSDNRFASDRSRGADYSNSYNNDAGFGSSGIGMRSNAGHDDILGSRYGRRESVRHREGLTNRQGPFSGNSDREREGHWLDRNALQRNRDYGSDDRTYSNRYGRGMYANPEEKYEDEDEDIRDVRLDSTYDEIENQGDEDSEDIDSNYENLYKREARDDDRSKDWSGPDRNYDIEDYRR
jgi:hypothetical protein